jgi:branched-chain amino acid transport system permease protein
VGAYGAALMITKLSQSPWLGFIAGPLLAALISLIMGIICVRLSKLYFGMLQISLGSLVWVVVYRWYSFTGGDDGIHGVPMPSLIASPKGAYYFLLLVTAACLAVMYRIVKSPFGSALQGIRDNPVRSEAVGVNVKLQQLVALVIAGFFGGVAGVLFVVVDKAAFPDMLFWTLSLEVLIMCLLGGWFTFFGPLAGAAILVSLRTFASTYTEYWTLIQGIILILVIIFLPEGVLGFLHRKWSQYRLSGQAGEK